MGNKKDPRFMTDAELDSAIENGPEIVRQTFYLYDRWNEQLDAYSSALEEKDDEGLNLVSIARSMAMVLNDLCDKLEEAGAPDVRADICGQVNKFLWVNKRGMMGH